MTQSREIYRRATAGRRVIAFAIDVVLLTVSLVIGWVLLTLILASRGQTPGKALTRLAVVRPDGSRLGVGRLMLRELVLKVLLGSLTLEISTLVGAIQVAGWWGGQAWWDRLVGSVVVHRARTEAEGSQSESVTS